MKSSLYFNHDYNARNDPKLKRARRIKGLEAKGLYWDLVEILCEQGGYYPLSEIDEIVYEEHLEDKDLLEWLIFESELFSNDGERFWSNRQLKDQRKREAIAEKRRLSGAAGREARAQNLSNNKTEDSKSLANAQQLPSNCQANASQINKEINKININNNISKDIFVDEKPSTSGKKVDIPFKAIHNLWNDTISEKELRLAKIISMSEARKTKVSIRWKEMESVGDPIEVVRTMFSKVAESKFLCGDNRNGWKCSFDWLFDNSKNWVKVYEGSYDDTPVKPSSQNNPQTDSSLYDKWS